MQPSDPTRENDRKTAALGVACQFARMTPDELAFAVMFGALDGTTADEVESAVKEIAKRIPDGPWLPSSEIMARVRLDRYNAYHAREALISRKRKP